MEIKSIILRVFVITAIAAITMASCNQVKNNAKEQAALAGMKISDEIINIFDQYDSQIIVQQYYTDMIAILNSNSFTGFDPEIQTDPTLAQAFAALRSLYENYSLVQDQNMAKNRTNFDLYAAKCLEFIEILDTDSLVDKKVTDMKSALEGMKIQYDWYVWQITDLYLQIWKKQVERIKKENDELIENLEIKIKTIKPDIFDPDKLAKTLNDPFADTKILAEIYKLNMIKNISAALSQQQNEFADLELAMNALNAVFAEINKKRPDNKIIEYNIGLINDYFANKENKNKDNK